MPRLALASGLLLGLAAALALPARAPERQAFAPAGHGALLSDCGGPLRHVVLHHVAASAAVTEVPYRELLARLPERVRVTVVCPAQADFDDLCRRLGPLALRLEPAIAGHALTAWSRDRWLAFAPAEQGGPTLLLAPSVEDGARVWPERAGDQRSAEALSRALPERVHAARSPLVFDGGDFVADDDLVVVSPRVLRRNPDLERADLELVLRRALGREVLLLDEAPDHHAGMYLMLVGRRRALVADPSLAADLLQAEGVAPGVPADRSGSTQASLDAVARALAGRGYAVTRMPVVVGADGRTWRTCLNVLLDREAEGRGVAYVPSFADADPLFARARAVWEGVGYEVVPIDCRSAYVHGGSLRCLVNVLARDAAPGTP